MNRHEAKRTQVDVHAVNHGSIWLLRPISPEAKAWIDDNTSANRMFFAGQLVVEPRYVADLAERMKADGLLVGC